MSEQIRENLVSMLESGCEKMILSKPCKTAEYRRINITRKVSSDKDAQCFYQMEKLTEKQAFHENVSQETLAERLAAYLQGEYRQLNGFGNAMESVFLVSKKGKVAFKQKRTENGPKTDTAHNRKKRYLLEEGEVIPPLVDMGIFTPEGKIVASMQDKFRQINRFIEMIDDYVRTLGLETLNIIDFGCGKSYLTFILYYYLTVKQKIAVQMIGLDLKADVIEKCNRAAKKYGYQNLRFELGNINGYQVPFAVDMVISLHACDTATDFALYNAVRWNAKLIFSVPCCQHELNAQMKSETFSLMTRYGIVKERFAALATDAIRANLLEYCGYKTQILEFVELSHTPKNLLIRGILKQGGQSGHQKKLLEEAERMIEEYHLEPTLYRLITKMYSSSVFGNTLQ